ncbi:MAG: hypothetical protein ACE363_12295 [Alphaproteobacteria bacterium]
MSMAESRLEAARRAKRGEEKRVRRLLRTERDEANRIEKLGRPGPTPQTAKRLKPHAVETLLDRGVIDESQAGMLDQIARAYGLITMGTDARISSWERVDGGRLPTDSLPSEVRLLRHYAAWWDRLSEYGLQRSMSVIIDVAVDGVSLNDLARARRMDKRTAKRLLIQGLDCWADAGRQRR